MGVLPGVEHYLKKLDGVLLAESGYCGGDEQNPDYKNVCNGNTGYLEVVRVIFDTNKTSLEAVLKYFFEIHDFTQTNGQGPDIGEQYKSAVFYYDENQKLIADGLINILAEKGYKVATNVRDVKPYYVVEDYHLDYYLRNGSIPYCHSHTNIF